MVGQETHRHHTDQHGVQIQNATAGTTKERQKERTAAIERDTAEHDAQRRAQDDDQEQTGRNQ